jgi:hypothetical protein
MHPRRIAPVFHAGLELRPRGERGAGIVVTNAVAAGSVILAFGGPVLDRRAYMRRPEIDHCIQVGTDTFLGPSGDLDDFTNHSCDPTTRIEIDPVTLQALMVARFDLKPGVEATFDYSTVQLDDPRFRIETCLCGAPSCRRRIGDFTLLSWREKTRLFEEGLCVYYIADAYRHEAATRGVTIRERPQR